MWDAHKQQQLDRLRRWEQARDLTSDERRLLEQLLGELDGEEAVLLGSAVAHAQQETARLADALKQQRAKNAMLADLAERQAALLTRAKAQLALLVVEHEQLKAEYEQTVGRRLSPIGA